MLPDDFWDDERRRLLAVLGPLIEHSAQQGAEAGGRKLIGIGLNLDLANQHAADWARQYTDHVLEQLGTTSEALVGEALAEWIERPGATMGDLVELLSPRFANNTARADLIAVTETTRAYANGEKAAYLTAGITSWRWNTNRDELVCPVCGAINGKVVKIDEPFGEFRGKPFTEPPAHPGCRCFVSAAVGNRAKSQDRSIAERVRDAQRRQANADRAYHEIVSSISPDASDLEIIRHFMDSYNVLIDLAPGNSITVEEAQMIDRVLQSLPPRAVRDNPKFTELALTNTDHPEYPDARGVHYRNRITIFNKARSLTASLDYTDTGSVLSETLLHEVGESIYKTLPAGERQEWEAIVRMHGRMKDRGQPPNELFAIWFSRVWVKDPGIPSPLEIWMLNLMAS